MERPRFSLVKGDLNERPDESKLITQISEVRTEMDESRRALRTLNYCGLGIIATVIGLIASGIYVNESTNMQRHMALPIEIRKYDYNKNGVLELHEAQDLINSYAPR